MAEIKTYSRNPANNADPPPDGAPEGMARSLVNDTIREEMAATRLWYEAPEWLNLLVEDDGYTVSRVDDDTINVVYAGASPLDATGKFPVGSRIRIGDGSTLVEGFVTAAAYVNPNTTVDIDFDGASIVQVGANSAEIQHSRDSLGRTAYSPRGTALGQDPPEVPAADDLGSAAFEDTGDGNGLDADLLDGLHASDLQADIDSSRGPILINGGFGVWQRGASITAASPHYNNDNASVVADKWVLLSGSLAGTSNDVVDVSKIDSGPPGAAPGAIELLGSVVATPSEKVGLLQMLPSAACRHLRGQTVSLRFHHIIDTGGDINFVRGGIVEWNGAPDAISSKNIVTNWNTADVDPSLIINATFATGGTKRDPTSDAWSEFSLEGVVLGSSFENLGVMLWVDDTGWTSTHYVRFAGASLVRGSRARDIENPSQAADLLACLPFFESTFDNDVTPQQGIGILGAAASQGTANGSVLTEWRYFSKFKTPTITTFNPISLNNQFRNAVDATNSPVTVTTISKEATQLEATAVMGNANDKMVIHVAAEADVY